MADDAGSLPGANTALNTFTNTSVDDTSVHANAIETFGTDAGNVTLTRASGDDQAIGRLGVDNLVGDLQTGHEFGPCVLTITEDYDLSVDFASGGNTGNDMVGMYKIDPTSGQFDSITIVDQDVSNCGGTFSSVVSAGEQISFFVVKGGYAINDFDGLGPGDFQIVPADGGQHRSSHKGSSLQHVSFCGLITPISGYLLYSSGVKRLTSDADHQFITGLRHDDKDWLKITFDDAISLNIDVGRINCQARNDANSLGKWEGAAAGDIFVYAKGGSQNTIRDFNVNFDQIDLSAYDLNYKYLKSRMINHGWATEIILEKIDKSHAGDKILISAVEPDDFNEANFIF